jgi:hypothetical protein
MAGLMIGGQMMGGVYEEACFIAFRYGFCRITGSGGGKESQADY